MPEMKPAQENAQRQSQRQTLSPRLLQAVELLALPAVELRALVEKESLENPLLEIADGADPVWGEKAALPDALAAGLAPNAPASADEADFWRGGDGGAAEFAQGGAGGDAPAASDSMAELGRGVAGTWQDGAAGGWRGREGWTRPEPLARGRRAQDFAGDAGRTLAEELLAQLAFAVPAGEKELGRAAAFLARSLDAAGYLPLSLGVAARAAGVSLSVMEKALALVQSLEPAGVGARDLAECLRLQATRRGIYHGLLARLIDAHLVELGAGKIKEIAAVEKTKPADVQRAWDALRALSPKPGAGYGREPAGYILPDVIVRETADGYAVELAENALPRVRLSNFYLAAARAADAGTQGKSAARAADADTQEKARSAGGGEAATQADTAGQDVSQDGAAGLTGDFDAATREYLREKIGAAKWLLEKIESRGETILSVAREIVRRQAAAVKDGSAALRPLTMAEVARAIGVHESTVSRAVAGKYLLLPRGIAAMKDFFTARLGADAAGEAAETRSAAAAKAAIQQLVEREDARKPLSDAKIVALLAAQNITLSRRTVVKYREQLGIPSSAKRRRY